MGCFSASFAAGTVQDAYSRSIRSLASNAGHTFGKEANRKFKASHFQARRLKLRVNYECEGSIGNMQYILRPQHAVTLRESASNGR